MMDRLHLSRAFVLEVPMVVVLIIELVFLFRMNTPEAILASVPSATVGLTQQTLGSPRLLQLSMNLVF